VNVKIGDAHNLFSALQRIDADTNLRLDDKVRLAVVINMNRLIAPVQAYERMRQRKFAELREKGCNEHKVFVQDPQLFDAKWNIEDAVLRDETVELSLQMVSLDDMKQTKGESHIPGLTFLRPMIKEWYSEAESSDQAQAGRTRKRAA
jgi:hypothetical protein